MSGNMKNNWAQVKYLHVPYLTHTLHHTIENSVLRRRSRRNLYKMENWTDKQWKRKMKAQCCSACLISSQWQKLWLSCTCGSVGEVWKDLWIGIEHRMRLRISQYRDFLWMIWIQACCFYVVRRWDRCSGARLVLCSDAPEDLRSGRNKQQLGFI